MMNCKQITKYLEVYAENQALNEGLSLSKYIKSSLINTFEHVVVIPAYKESTDFISRLVSSNLSTQSVLYIVVINQPEYDVNKQPQEDLLKYIQQVSTSRFKDGSVQLLSIKGESCFLTIDAFSQPLPSEQGVGLARKIGADFALFLINENIVKSHWIHSTDADAHLPNNYFQATTELNNDKQHNKTAAVSYNFTHTTELKSINDANRLYETALRYYVAGLHYANSSYDFFTIGSVIAFKAKEYALVRGFPKRSAGEDFYLLNKLAKLGKVQFLKDTIVNIDARTSDRVPFGTGPSVANILQLEEENLPYCYYHPSVFDELKVFINDLTVLWDYRLNFNKWLTKLTILNQQAAIDSGLERFVTKQCNNNKEQFNKQLNVWFDAFKTLKFIHSLRDNKYADIPLSEALTLAKFSVEF